MDCETALRSLRAIDSYLTTGAGDMKKLQPPRHEFRFRLGDDRVLFLLAGEHSIEVLRVLRRALNNLFRLGIPVQSLS